MTINEWLKENCFDAKIKDENGIGDELVTKTPQVVNGVFFAGSGWIRVDFGFENNAARFRRALVVDEYNNFSLIYCS